MKTLPVVALALYCMAQTGVCQNLGSTFFESNPYGSSRNLGSSLTLFSGAMTVTARYRIDPTATGNVNASGLTGTIYLDANSSPYIGGLGVQDAGGGSSQGISGGGPNQDEELIFNYNAQPARLDTVQVMINSFDASAAPVLFLETNLGDFVFNTAQIKAAGSPSGASGDAAESWTINFSSLAGTVGSPAAELRSFAIRETGAHTFVKGVTGGILIPEPGTLLLSAAALPLLLLHRRKSGD